jgi:hypothetical protein
MKTSIPDGVLSWLLEGDPAIVYQVKRDLLDAPEKELKPIQRRIDREGWGRAYLDRQQPDGHWGRGPYQPKWICTHYSLFDMMTLQAPRDNPGCRKAALSLLAMKRGTDGGINYARTVAYSDVCLNGMLLNMGSWFTPDSEVLPEIVDYLLQRQHADGGWNCLYYQGDTHGSVHTTLGVIEGLVEHGRRGGVHRNRERARAVADGFEFLLRHRLYKSERTGEPFDPKVLKLAFPCRWRYDVLRAMEGFAAAGARWDERMSDAMESIMEKRRKDGTWPLQSRHPGEEHFPMEQVGKPSRWNTLRALRVMRHFGLG